MKKELLISILCILCFSFITGCGGGSGTPSDTGLTSPSQNTSAQFTDPLALPSSDSDLAEHKTGEIVVSYKTGEDPSVIASSVNGTVSETFSIGEKKYAVLAIPEGNSIVSSIKTLEKLDGVVYGEPNYISKSDFVPNDPLYSNQYAPQICGGEGAWDITKGDSNLIIAITDTGVNGLHPEFSGKMVPGRDSYYDADIPDPYINSDVDGHGTHVAGISAAIGNNSIGISGIAPNCKIMPVRISNDQGSSSDSSEAKGIVWAVDHGAKVINMSFGGRGYAQVVADAIGYALEHNVVFCCSMGNDGHTLVKYPASYQGSIAVGAINGKNELTLFSTTGIWMCVTAPGEHILSTTRDGGYELWDGTSMSTPFVTGVCALIFSAHPALTSEEVRSQLEQTATDLGDTGFDKKTGWGKPNVKDAVGALKANKYGRLNVTVPSSGLSVVIYDSNGMVGVTKSDASNIAHFYYVDCNKTGYVAKTLSGTTLEKSFTVTPGVTTNITIP